MLFYIKKITGPVYPFLVFLMIAVILLFLSRLGLSIWQFDRVSAADGWLPVMLQGLRVDVATIIMMVGVVALFSIFLSGTGIIGRVWNKVARVSKP